MKPKMVGVAVAVYFKRAKPSGVSPQRPPKINHDNMGLHASFCLSVKLIYRTEPTPNPFSGKQIAEPWVQPCLIWSDIAVKWAAALSRVKLLTEPLNSLLGCSTTFLPIEGARRQ